MFGKPCGGGAAGWFVEEPEAGHGGVPDGDIVAAKFEAEFFPAGQEVGADVDVGHAVIAEEVEADVAVVAGREVGKGLEIGGEVVEGGIDFRVLDAVLVHHGIEAGGEQIDQLDIAFFDIAAGVGDVFGVRAAPIRAGPRFA